MVLALPSQNDGLVSLAARLEPGRWRVWMTEFVEAPRLALSLPRFELEWEASLIYDHATDTILFLGQIADPRS